MQTINQGGNSMRPELLTKRDACGRLASSRRLVESMLKPPEVSHD
jgi:hypothetical protein